MTTKLKSMPYAQAHINHYDDGTIELVSYSTTVLTLTADGWLYVYGLYSMTTRRHIGAFMHEFCGNLDYYTAKRCYEMQEVINIGTGEIRDMREEW